MAIGRFLNKAISGGQKIFNKVVDTAGGVFTKSNISNAVNKIDNTLGKVASTGSKVIGGIEKALPAVSSGLATIAPELIPQLSVANVGARNLLQLAKKGLDRVGQTQKGVKRIGDGVLGVM